ncbi:MAG: putative sugar kinase YdjH [Chlamydiae bacterium]|nr:putative sugar kinase YdjH [Chlamydiota bacterium]
MSEIIGIGGPILDQILPVPDDFLTHVPGKKGGMEPISFPLLEELVAKSGAEPVLVPGGSARNTLHGLARFGEPCALLGMVGSDSRGVTFRKKLEEVGIGSLLLESETPTAIVLSLVTPDGERTMRTFQGASTELRGAHLEPSHFSGAKLVHLEGYTLFNGDLAETAMRMAKEAGAKVSFDLASFEIVEQFRETILSLADRYVDLLFANEMEAKALTGEEGELGCARLAELAEIGILLQGPLGCFVQEGKHRYHCPAYPVEPLDTTGAGDLFTSGFLHGYRQGYPLEICAQYGAISGRAVVQVMGPVIPHEQWSEIFAKLKPRL